MSVEDEFRKSLKNIRDKYYADVTQSYFQSTFSFNYSTFYHAVEGHNTLRKTTFDKFIKVLEKNPKIPKEEIESLKNQFDKVQNLKKVKKTDTKRFPIKATAVGLISLALIVAIAYLVSNSKAQTPYWTPIYANFNGITMAKVPSGCFIMGNLQGRENEKPTHNMCFEDDFWIGKTEITNSQFGSPPDKNCNTNQVDKLTLVNKVEENYPRNCVTWQEALEFCQSKGLRLPTEAEWEYAARGSKNLLYPWGNDPNPAYAILRTDVNDPANHGQMLPVGSKPQDVSWIGTYDMAGSLREFTSTIYDTITLNGSIYFSYPYNSQDGREALENTGTSLDEANRNQDTTLRVVRGGGFDKTIDRATTTFRAYEFFDFRWNEYGFRCAGDL